MLTTATAYAQNCSDRPVKANCDFYSECLEDSYNCQNTDFNYPIEYGDRFCNDFEDTRQELTARGQLWIDRTMVCLQQTLFDKFLENSIFSFLLEDKICRKVSDVAFASHHRCYVKPTGNYREGICPLWKDYKVIFQTGRPWEAIGTKYSGAVRKQVVQTAKSCIGYWLSFKQKKSLRREIPIDSILQQLEEIIKE